jgi:hypothetical protein
MARIIVRTFDNTRWHSRGVAGEIVLGSVQEATKYAARYNATARPGTHALALSAAASATFLARGKSTAGNNRMVHVIRDIDGDHAVAYCGARIPRQPQATQNQLPKCKRCHH